MPAIPTPFHNHRTRFSRRLSPAIAAIATLLLSAAGTKAQPLKIDFNDKDAEITQSGWVAFSSTTDPNNKTLTFGGYDDLAGPGNDVSVTSAGIEYSRDAGAPDPASGIDDMHRDLIFRNDATTPITLTIGGLLAGNYELRTHHHVESAGGGSLRSSFTLDVQDSDSPAFGQTVGTITMGGEGSPADSGVFVVTSNGTDDVVLRFTATNIAGVGGQDWWGINGLEITATNSSPTPSGQLQVDFTHTGGPVETGWNGYFATQESGATFTPQDFTAFGTTITVAPTWAAGANDATKQMYDRSSSGYPGAHPDLINQWIGTDGRQPGDPLTLTLTGLPAGRYIWRSYHHDPHDQTGVFTATIVDSTGTRSFPGIPMTDSIQDGVVDFADISVFETEISSDGTTPVAIDFDLTSSTGNITTAFFLMNGFELFSTTAATLPAPADGATDVDAGTSLSWIAPTEYTATGYDLYFGTDPVPTNNPAIHLATTTYDPPADLAPDTTYYWSVDSFDGTTKHPGAVWSFTTMPPPQPADQVAGNLILFNDNGQWCWYQDERVIYDPVADTIVFASIGHYSAYGGLDRDGDQDVSAFHVGSGTRSRTTVREGYTSYGEGNDHHAGALWIRPDGRYLHMYTGHNEPSFNHWCNLTRQPNDPANWIDGATFHWPSSLGTRYGSTYTNLFFMADEGTNGRLYNISREGDERTPMIAYSDDWGNTWSYGGKVCRGNGSSYSNGYTVLAGNGTDRIDFTITEHHPRQYSNSIYHGYIKGGKSYNSTGTVIDSDIFDDSYAPIASDFTPVFQAQPVAAGNYHHAWTVETEIAPDGGVHALFTTRYGTATDIQTGDKDHRLFYARFDGTQWHTTELCKMGGGIRLSGENDYTGLGAIHPENPDIIYVSTPIDPRTDIRTDKAEIYKGVTTDQGATWSWSAVTSASTKDNYRPIIPSWDADHTAVLWLRGDYTQTGPRSQAVVGVIERTDQGTTKTTYLDADGSNTTLADGSPLATTGPSDSDGTADGIWHEHTGYGNGGSVLLSGATATEDAPGLKTSITGLADGTYDVFVFFWALPDDDWRIRAGFSTSDMLVFQQQTSQQAPADSFTAPVDVLAGHLALYRAYVGRRTVAGGAAINVFLDDFDGAATAGSERTAYDGIGVARVLPVLRIASGQSTTIQSASGPYASIHNEGSLVVKGAEDLAVDGAFTNDGFLDLLNYSGALPPGFANNGTILDRSNADTAPAIALQGDTAVISIGGYAGHSYQLQSSATLEPGDWRNLGAPVPGTGANGTTDPLEFQDPDALPGDLRKFYRVLID
jgi:hypothetical protein